MKKQILILDDSLSIRVMLRELLEPMGYEITEAVDGNDGLMKLRNAPAHLVITDIVMPDREGLEVIREIKRDYKDVKIIAISGGGKTSASEYLRFAELFGAHCVFKKPFKPRDVLIAVQELLDA